jgi:hypothetical protein
METRAGLLPAPARDNRRTFYTPRRALTVLEETELDRRLSNTEGELHRSARAYARDANPTTRETLLMAVDRQATQLMELRRWVLQGYRTKTPEGGASTR